MKNNTDNEAGEEDGGGKDIHLPCIKYVVGKSMLVATDEEHAVKRMKIEE